MSKQATRKRTGKVVCAGAHIRSEAGITLDIIPLGDHPREQWFVFLGENYITYFDTIEHAIQFCRYYGVNY